MGGEPGAGQAFAVTADAMMRAAADLRVIAASVRDGSVEGAADQVDFGHPVVASAAADFCARWNRGVSRLIGGNEQMADRLGVAVRAYVAADAAASAAFEELWARLDGAGA